VLGSPGASERLHEVSLGTKDVKSADIPAATSRH